jgi:hypothetical protein
VVVRGNAYISTAERIRRRDIENLVMAVLHRRTTDKFNTEIYCFGGSKRGIAGK